MTRGKWRVPIKAGRLNDMRRGVLLACLAWGLAGCATSQRIGPAGNLDQRLAQLAAQRLGAARAGEIDHIATGAMPLQVRANRPASVSLHRAAERGTIQNDSTVLSLAVFDEPSSGEPAPPLESASAEETPRTGPLPSLRQTIKRDLKEMPADLWRDTKRVYANPVNLAILAGAYGGSLALRETGVDRSIEHHFNTNDDGHPPHHDMSEDWRKGFDALGNPGTHFALAGLWYLLGQQTTDDKTYEVGKTLFSALIINGLTVIVGQAATFDKAPNGLYGTMPSGHTSSSFVVASVMHEAYGHVVGFPLYGLAGLCAFQRLDDREHYFSDVIMGGVLGLVVGHSVASGRNPEFFGWKLVPWASPQNGAGVAFVKTLE